MAIDRLHVGGGVSASDAACQIQADVLGIPIVRAKDTETSVRAAALLGGLGAGVWAGEGDLPRLPGPETIFEPRHASGARDAGLAAWHRALGRARQWV